MAEEKNEDEAMQDIDGAKPPKKSNLKLIVLASVVLILGAGGFFGWKWYADRKGQSEAEQTQDKLSIIYPFKSFIVNLTSKQGIGKRYLKITMELEVGKEEEKRKLEHHVPQLRDTVLLMLSSRTLEDINSMESKLELKQTLLSRMNQILGEAIIQRVYFTEFVVQ